MTSPGAPMESTRLAPARETGWELKEHEASPDCWCEPAVDSVDPDTGATVYVHKEMQ